MDLLVILLFVIVFILELYSDTKNEWIQQTLSAHVDTIPMIETISTAGISSSTSMTGEFFPQKSTYYRGSIERGSICESGLQIDENDNDNDNTHDCNKICDSPFYSYFEIGKDQQLQQQHQQQIGVSDRIVPPGKWCLPTYSIRPTCDPNFGRKILHPNMVWTCMALSPVLFDESGVQVACATNTAVIPIYDYGSFRFVDNAVGIVDPFEKLSDGITFRYRCHQDTIDRLNDSTTSKNYIVSRINHFVIGEDPCTKTLKNKLSGLGFRNVAGGSSSIGSSHGECDCLDSDVTGVSNRFYHDYKSPCWSCYERINNAGETYSLPYPCISANSINRIHDETDEPVKTLCGETKYYEFDSMCEDIEIRITRAAVKRPPKIVTTVT